MLRISVVIFLFTLFSCQKNPQTNIKSFRIGEFKTVLEDDKTTSFASRNDSLQIETFNNEKDTFKIEWINDFEYILLKKNPKTMLDSTPFHVKITAIKNNSYDFKAYYKGSKFKQKGTAFKLN